MTHMILLAEVHGTVPPLSISAVERSFEQIHPTPCCPPLDPPAGIQLPQVKPVRVVQSLFIPEAWFRHPGEAIAEFRVDGSRRLDDVVATMEEKSML